MPQMPEASLTWLLPFVDKRQHMLTRNDSSEMERSSQSRDGIGSGFREKQVVEKKATHRSLTLAFVWSQFLE